MQLDGLIYFFLMICIGYFAAKSRLLPQIVEDALPSLLLNICYPALILVTFASTDTAKLLDTGLPVVITTLIVTVLLYFLSYFLFRRMAPNRIALMRFITGVGNVTYVAIPLLSIFLSEEAMLVVILNCTAQDFLIWTLYQQLFLRGGCKKQVVKKLFTSPCILAVLLGTLLAAFQLCLPSFVQMTLDSITATTSPIALLYLGMLVKRYGLLAWRRDKTAIAYSVGKIIVLPLILFGIFQFFLSVQTSIVLAIAFGSPAPLTSMVWAREYDGDVPLSVNCCIASTLLFLIVMSAALLLLTNFGIL